MWRSLVVPLSGTMPSALTKPSHACWGVQLWALATRLLGRESTPCGLAVSVQNDCRQTRVSTR